MKGAYFDNAAATALHPDLPDYRAIFANPSSLHAAGMASEQKISAASEKLARLLRAQASEIIYTSGATESNNLAVKGIAEARKNGHIITSEIEHPSVSECFKALNAKGFSVTYLKADRTGIISPEALADAITPETALVSLFYINSETGAINDIGRLARVCKEKNNKTVFHTDAAQAFGKIPLTLKNVDTLSFSAHKIHGPKGCGGLYVKKGVRLTPLLHGGGQQNGIRPGTENIQGILGLCDAFEWAYTHMEANYGHVLALKEKILEIQDIGGVYINGGGNASPYILNISADGVKGEILLNALSAEGFYVSTGSACHSRRGKQNAISKIAPERADSALRISFSAFNTLDECEALNGALRRNIRELRKH